MQFTKKTLVVMMCAALQAGVVMAQAEEAQPVMPVSGEEVVVMEGKTIHPEDVTGDNVAHAYYVYSLNSGLNYDGTEEPFKTKVNAESTDPVTLTVVNNADTGPDEGRVNSTIMAGGIVSNSIGIEGHEASTLIKTGSTLNINVTNNKSGTDNNVTSAFGVSTYTKGKADTTSTYDGDVTIDMTNHADYSDLVGMKQHVLDGGAALSVFNDDVSISVHQEKSGIANGFIQQTDSGKSNNVDFNKKLIIDIDKSSLSVEGLTSIASLKYHLTEEQNKIKELSDNNDNLLGSKKSVRQLIYMFDYGFYKDEKKELTSLLGSQFTDKYNDAKAKYEEEYKNYDADMEAALRKVWPKELGEFETYHDPKKTILIGLKKSAGCLMCMITMNTR